MSKEAVEEFGKEAARIVLEASHKRIVYPWLTHGDAKVDREIAHERALDLMENTLEQSFVLRDFAEALFNYPDPVLETEVMELKFRNPLGLAAGFDKNGRIPNSLGSLGFGHIEIGSITKIPYPGNLRIDEKTGRLTPRIFTLPKDDGVINRLGFPGDGSDQVRENLINKREALSRKKFVMGVNVSASRRSFDRGTAVEDMAQAYEELYQYADYVTGNVSSPNTQDLRTQMQNPENLDRFLTLTDQIWESALVKKALLIKFAPDMTWNELVDLIAVLNEHHVSGMVLTNTTVDPEIRSRLLSRDRNEAGGISGRPLTQKRLEISQRVYEYTKGSLVLINAGGIIDDKDVWEAMSYGGASLAQSYAGFVLERTSSPSYAYKLNKNLARNLRYAGKTARNLVGSKVPYPGI